MVFTNLLNKKVTGKDENKPAGRTVENEIINDLPSLDTFLNQKVISPDPTKSTNGLIGFDPDSGSVIDRVLKSQSVPVIDLKKFVMDEIFGTVQVPTPTQGGTQTKEVNVGFEFSNTFKQQEMAKMNAKEKIDFLRILKEMSGQTLAPIHQLTDDAVKDPQGKKDPKQIVRSSMGFRKQIDELNAAVRGLLLGARSVKALAGDKVAAAKNEVASSTPSQATGQTITKNVNHDRPLAFNVETFL